VFVPSKPFQPSLIFVRKPCAYLSEAPLWPYPQALDKTGKTYQGKTLMLVANIRKLRP